MHTFSRAPSFVITSILLSPFHSSPFLKLLDSNSFFKSLFNHSSCLTAKSALKKIRIFLLIILFFINSVSSKWKRVSHFCQRQTNTPTRCNSAFCFSSIAWLSSLVNMLPRYIKFSACPSDGQLRFRMHWKFCKQPSTITMLKSTSTKCLCASKDSFLKCIPCSDICLGENTLTISTIQIKQSEIKKIANEHFNNISCIRCDFHS